MKLNWLPSYSQFNKTKEKNSLTSKQSKVGHKGVFIVRGSLQAYVLWIPQGIGNFCGNFVP